jgi:hypothetical protein
VAETGTPVAGVTVEIRAPIDRLNADFAAAEARTRQADAAMAQAMGGTKAATTDLARAQLALIETFRATGQVSQQAMQAVGGYAASQALLTNETKSVAAAQAVLAGAEREVAATSGQAAAGALALGLAQGRVTQAVERATAAVVTNRAVHLDSRAAYEGTVLIHEAMMGRFSRLPGSLMIMSQRLAGTAGTAAALGAALEALPLIAVAAAVVGGIVAWAQYEDAMGKAAQVAAGLGATSEATGRQLEQLAQSATAASNITEGDAHKAAEAFAAAGDATNATIAGMTDNVAFYARMTGEKMPEAIKTLAEALKDPEKGAKALNDQFNFLDETELRNIETLSQLGEKTEAQNRLTQDFANYANTARSAGFGLGNAFDSMASAATRAWSAIGSLEDVIARFEYPGQMAAGAARAAGLKTQAGLNEASTAAGDVHAEMHPDDAREAALRARVERLQKGADAERALAARNAGNPALAAQHLALAGRNQEDVHEAEIALKGYASVADRKHALVTAEIADAGAKTVAQKRAAAEEKERITLSGEAMSDEERARAIKDAGDLAATRKEAHHKAGSHAVADETGRIKANTEALLAEASAYLASDSAAAQRLQAGKQAADYAIGKKGANIAALTDEFLGQDVAEAASKGAQKAASIRAETEAQRGLDDQVASGLISARQAEEMAKDDAELRPLLVSLKNADAAATVILTAAIKGLTEAQAASNAEDARKRILDLTDAQNAKNAEAPEVTGLTLRQRLVAEAQAKSLEQIKAAGGSATGGAGPELMAANVAGANKAADQANRKFVDDETDAVKKQTEALSHQRDTWGMTVSAAAAYDKEQEILLAAGKKETDLNAAQAKALHDVADAYGTAAGAASKFAGAMAAEKSVVTGLEGAIEGAIFDHKNLGEELKSFGRDQLRQIFKAEMTGEGPWAKMLGTGEPGGGALNKVLGPLFGLHAGGGKPDGSEGNPLHVVMGGGAGGAGGGGQGGGGIMGFLKGLMGGGGGGQGAGGIANILGAPGSATDAESAFGDVAGLFHNGTPYATAGGGGTRNVNLSMFTRAPRLHSGLASDEFPAILQKGEGVTARGAQGTRGHQITFNLAGANGDAAIRRISTAGVMRGMQLIRAANPGETLRHNLLQG